MSERISELVLVSLISIWSKCQPKSCSTNQPTAWPYMGRQKKYRYRWYWILRCYSCRWASARASYGTPSCNQNEQRGATKMHLTRKCASKEQCLQAFEENAFLGAPAWNTDHIVAKYGFFLNKEQIFLINWLQPRWQKLTNSFQALWSQKSQVYGFLYNTYQI